MSIVRELVTKLSFAFDRTNLDKFEKAITNVKKSIVTTTGDIVGAISKTVEFFRDLAQSTLSIKNLSNYAGVAVSEFVAMRQAAKQLGVSFENFDKISFSISKSIRDSRVNTGKLSELWQAFPGKVQLPKFINQAEDFKDVITSISSVIEGFSSESDKLEAISHFFEVDLDTAGQLLRFLDKVKTKFDGLIESNRELGKSTEDSLPDVERYEIAVNNLEAQWHTFWTTLKHNFVPLAAETLRISNQIIENTGAIAKEQGSGISGFFKSLLSAPVELASLYYNDFFGSKQGKAESLGQSGSSFSPQLQTTNNFVFNVPPGTTQEQGNFMFEQVRKSFDEIFDEKIRDVVSNNPMLE